MASATAARDGTSSFASGVNSLATTTLASDRTPSGLKRDEMAWLINLTCRDGGLTPRSGWLRTAQIFGMEGLFQGCWFYRPVGAFPYLMASFNGEILKIDPDTGAVRNLSQEFGLYNNTTEPFAFYAQAEEFGIFQSGDNVTLPLFWDNVTLRRSNGITGNVSQPSSVVYTFTTTSVANLRKVPPVGGTVTLDITAMYGGAANDIGVLTGAGVNFGTFEVMAFTVVAPFTIDLKTISSDKVGSIIPNATDYEFALTAVPVPVPINEIPAATAMVYYMSRLWYAQGRVFTAGDIVFGPSGTAAYGFRDSVLKVTENPLAIGGDGFIVPSQDGEIRGLMYGANIDAALGQGRLFIFTIKAVYALQVPVNRDDWIAAGADREPLMTVVQLANGSVNDRSIVPVNGDLFYQSLEPGIRSLMQSTRYFTQWAQISLSANENRILQFADRALMRGSSGIFFNNRLYQTTLPRQTPQGVVHDQIVPLDVLPISSFQQQKTPNWEGSIQAMPTFQMAVADFGGRERAFAVVQARSGATELWEISFARRYDYAEEVSLDSRRIVSQVETPAWTHGDTIGEEELKKIVGAELWVDRLFGTTEFKVEYRPDGSACWFFWHEWSVCFPKDANEAVGFLPTNYPTPFGECFKRMTLVKPPVECGPCGSGRPAYHCYQVQIRLTMKGFGRLRGIWVWAEPLEQGLYPLQQVVC